MMKSFLSALLLATVLFIGGTNAQSSCTNFTKNSFGPGDVNSQSVCETACRLAEGLNVGDHNSEMSMGAMNMTITLNTCDCKASASASSSRTLCRDAGYSGAATMLSMLAVVLSVGVGMLYML